MDGLLRGLVLSKGIRREVKHLDMLGLKTLRQRVEYWYAVLRGAVKVAGMSSTHKRQQLRDAWDRFETAAEAIVKDTAYISGPEFEQQQYRNKPPRKGGFKEAA
jgi:hypothetical protein